MNSVRGCESPSRVDMLLEMVPQFLQPLRLLNSSHVNLHHSVVLRQTDVRLGNKTKIYEFCLVQTELFNHSNHVPFKVREM